jgi:hypothetical protein
VSEQKSQKRGLRSAAQKRAGARHEWSPTPAASPVDGAFGKREHGKGYEIPAMADAGTPGDQLEELEEATENEETPR